MPGQRVSVSTMWTMAIVLFCLPGPAIADNRSRIDTVGTEASHPAVRPAFVLAWMPHRAELQVHVFDKNYQSISPPPQYNPIPFGQYHDGTKLAMHPNGTIVAMWQIQQQLHNRSDNRMTSTDVKARVYDENGTPKGPAVLIAKLNETSQLGIVPLSPDRFLLLWTIGDTLNGGTFDNNLQRVKEQPPINVSLGTKSTHISAVPTESGFAIVWRTGEADTCSSERDNAIYLLTFDASNKPIAKPRMLARYKTAACHTAARRSGPGVAALQGGGAVITWREGDGASPEEEEIVAQIVDRLGHATRSTFRVNKPTPYHLEQNPSVLVLRNGEFVISWLSIGIGYDGKGSELDTMPIVRAQRFDRQGNRLGEEIVVSPNANGFSSAALANGGFVAVASGCGIDGNGCRVDYHVFDQYGQNMANGNVYDTFFEGGSEALAAPHH